MVAFGIAFRLRGVWVADDLFQAPSLVVAEIAFVGVYSALSVLIFQHFNLYKINVFITLVEHTVKIAKGLVVIVLGLSILAFFTRAPWIIDSRLAILYFTIIACGILFLVRVMGFRKIFLWFSRNQIIQREVLIVGAGETGKKLAVELMWHAHGGQHVVGFLDDELPLGGMIFGGAKVIGRLTELADVVRVFGIEEVIICVDGPGYSNLMSIIESAIKCCRFVKIASPLYSVVPSRLFMERYGRIPVVTVYQSGPTPMKERYKRAFDLFLGAIALVALSPAFIFIALLIKLDSAGPVFFRQTRIGRNGKPFLFYKFRSMTVGSENDEVRKLHVKRFIRSNGRDTSGNGASTKIVNETRITRIGRLLRTYSLDELPQLFNVLKGEMSLVGPRPCLPYEWEHYDEWHKRRLSVLPGCTGMWQVSGRSLVGFDDMVVLDMYYIQNSSLLLDLRLLLKTIPVMVFGNGGE